MSELAFDVIIPTYYTTPEHIQNAVQSVFNQTTLIGISISAMGLLLMRLKGT